MKNQKNLDDLYRERFLGKQVPPPEDAWANIMGRLPHKQAKKSLFIPFWYKLSGVAAVFLIAGTLALNYTGGTDPLDVQDLRQQITIEDHRDFWQTEKNAFENFNEQMRITSGYLEEIISENKGVKKGKKSNSFVAPQPVPLATTENTNDNHDRSGTPLASEETDRNQMIAEAEEIPEEKFPGTSASIEITEPLTREQDEEKIADSKTSRLSLSTKVAPLFTEESSNVGQGGTGNSIAYGLSITYKISDKLAIRSGITKMDINRSAPSVTYTSGVQAKTLDGSPNTSLASPTIDVAEKNSSFLEVPLEMAYTLMDKKLQLHLLGGSSLLFSTQNSVQEKGSQSSTPEGSIEPQKVHYTGNIGLGLGYQIVKNVEVNLEPTLKIRLGSSENLSPYFMGIYSGLSYRF